MDTFELVWKRIDENMYTSLEKWKNHDKDIDKYALFGSSFSQHVQWYKDNKKSISNIEDIIFVVFHQEIPIGFVSLNISCIKEKIGVGINPIIVNPDHRGKKIGFYILCELIQNSAYLLGHSVDFFMAVISRNNIKSIKVFSKIGFDLYKQIEDSECAEYRLFINNNEVA
jgi:RimJ/RimL family protein N-acetyltransferase